MKIFIAIIILFLLILSCDEEEIIQLIGSIEFSQDTLIFDEFKENEAYSRRISIINSYQNEVSYQITSKPEWIQISEEDEEGLITEEKEIELYVFPEYLDSTINSGEIKLLSENSDELTLRITAFINSSQELFIKSNKIFIDYPDTIVFFELHNSGINSLNWSILSDNALIEHSPSEGSIKAKSTQMIKLKTDFIKAIKNDYNYSSTISSNGGQQILEINLLKEDNKGFSINLYNQFFKPTDDFKIIRINNKSNRDMNWEVDSLPNFMKFTPDRGVLNAKATQYIEVKIDRDLIKVPKQNCNTKINLNGEVKYITFGIVAGDIIEEYLDFNISDAIYVQNENALIMLEKENRKLIKFNIDNKSIVERFLPTQGLAIDLNPKENLIAVGCYGSVLTIDPTNLEIVKTYDVTYEVFDLIFNLNNEIYIFTGNTFDSFKYIDLKTDSVKTINHLDIGDGYNAKRIPNSNNVIAVHHKNTLGVKFLIDTDNKTIKNLSDDIYSSTNKTSSEDFWLIGNNLLITHEGNIFNIDDLIDKNINTVHEFEYKITSASEVIGQNIFAVSENSLIKLYDYNFNLIDEILLPIYINRYNNSTSQFSDYADSDVDYIFINKNKKEIYSIIYPNSSELRIKGYSILTTKY